MGFYHHATGRDVPAAAATLYSVRFDALTIVRDGEGEEPVEPEPNTAGIGIVEAIDNLVAFWTFGEETGTPRLTRAGSHPLTDGHAAKVQRVLGGPFSGYSGFFDGTNTFLTLPNSALGALNISGENAKVTVVSWVRRDDPNIGFVAGIWQEDNNDPRRQ